MSTALHDPWVFQEGDLKDEDGAPCGSFVSVVNSASDSILWSDSESPEFEARFRLICAAPDLLAIVQTIVKLLDDGVPSALILDENSPTLDAIRDVLAKATGGAS